MLFVCLSLEKRYNYRNFEVLRDVGQHVNHVRVTPSTFSGDHVGAYQYILQSS